jgi:hypothetical protein
MYGLLSALGIEKGKPFNPDGRMKAFLERAAIAGRDQLLVSAFDSARPDRINWPDRKWEWVGLVPRSAQFETPAGIDLEARDRWFAQAIVTSPAMFCRSAGAGSLYWMSVRDSDGAYLDGGKNYKLTIPQPVPDKLFWSVTVYDAATRSQVQTDQNRAALRSLFELKGIFWNRAGRSLLRAERRPRGSLDQNSTRQGMVRVYPYLRTRAGCLRQKLEAGRFCKDKMTAVDRHRWLRRPVLGQTRIRVPP